MKKPRRLNWKPDLPDHRDYKLMLPAQSALPHWFSLQSKMPPVVDQLDIGSCTANAWAAILGFDEMNLIRSKQPGFDTFGDNKFDALSRLYIYWNERYIDGDTNEDSGAQLRDGVLAISKFGVCRETVWPYEDALTFRQPSNEAFQEGYKHNGIAGYRLNQDVMSMKACLYAGYPFVFGISAYESFMSDAVAQTGIVPMPLMNEKMVGGHALACVGWQDSTQTFIVRNSWSNNWGMSGYCKIPFNYLISTDLASDFWTLRKG